MRSLARSKVRLHVGRRGLSVPQEFKSRAQLAVVDLQAGGEFVLDSEHEPARGTGLKQFQSKFSDRNEASTAGESGKHHNRLQGNMMQHGNTLQCRRSLRRDQPGRRSARSAEWPSTGLRTPGCSRCRTSSLNSHDRIYSRLDISIEDAGPTPLN